jgi:hypothetical protein
MSPPINPVSVGLFGGFNENTTPALANVTIFYNESLDSFEFSGPELHTNTERIIVLNYLDATRDIVASEDFRAIRENRDMPVSERLPRTIEFLIRKIIERKVSVEVGGVPTVPVVKKGRSPRWYRKAKDCPDLQ